MDDEERCFASYIYPSREEQLEERIRELEAENARLREAIATLCVSEYLAPYLVDIARRALAGKGEAT